MRWPLILVPLLLLPAAAAAQIGTDPRPPDAPGPTVPRPVDPATPGGAPTRDATPVPPRQVIPPVSPDTPADKAVPAPAAPPPSSAR